MSPSRGPAPGRPAGPDRPPAPGALSRSQSASGSFVGVAKSSTRYAVSGRASSVPSTSVPSRPAPACAPASAPVIAPASAPVVAPAIAPASAPAIAPASAASTRVAEARRGARAAPASRCSPMPSARWPTMRFPRKALPAASGPATGAASVNVTRIPFPPLPTIAFRAAGSVPPTTLSRASTIATPEPPFAGGAEGSPAGSAPIRFPSMRFPPTPTIRIASPAKPRTARPRIVVPPPRTTNPWPPPAPSPAPSSAPSPAPAVALAPSTSIAWIASMPRASVFGREPGCVKPSRTTASAISGSGDASRIVCGPSPGIANAIRSGPSPLGWSFASRMAQRSEPGPSSASLATTKVRASFVAASAASAAGAGGTRHAITESAAATSAARRFIFPIRSPKRSTSFDMAPPSRSLAWAGRDRRLN